MSEQRNVGRAWEEAFASQPTPYALQGGLPFLKRFTRSPFIQLVLHYAKLPSGARILEAGCGSGKFSLAFALLGYSAIAFDYSDRILTSVANNLASIQPMTGPLKLDTCKGDLEKIDLKLGEFDLVMNEGVVEHWLDVRARQNVISQMAQVTKRGGVVAIIVPNGQHPWLERWLHTAPGYASSPPMIRYTPDQLRTDLETVGLRDIHLDGIYPWRSLDYWPTSHWRRWLGGGLQRVIPLPRAIRLRWGLHLIGLARKP